MARINVRRQDQDPVCNTDRGSTSWMRNRPGLDPCKVVEQIMRICSPAQPVTLGTVQNDMTCPGDPSSGCCCNVATYALMSACWICQGHKHKEVKTQIQPSYADFFQSCPDKNAVFFFPSDLQPQIHSLEIPPWAQIKPASLSNHWDFDEAQQNASEFSVASPTIALSTSLSFIPPTSTVRPQMSASSSPTPFAGSKSSTPSGTIAAAVLGALALVSLLCIGAWFFRRWRRRQLLRPYQGTRVDLTEPEMHEQPSRAFDLTASTAEPIQRAATFPFPYEGVVPRYHPDARHSFEPSRTEEEPTRTSTSGRRRSRRHTAPVPFSPTEGRSMDQLDRDLANLMGATPPQEPGQGTGQVHHPYIHKVSRRRASVTTFTPSENSGSASSRRSRRARRRSDADGGAQGRYFHLPPSAQYLADVARYPENVDPERPWNVRRDRTESSM